MSATSYFFNQHDEWSLEDNDVLDEFKITGQAVTSRVRRAILRFSRNTNNGLLLIKGLPVYEGSIGPTPNGAVPSRVSTARENAILLMLSSLYFDPMGWKSYLDGKIVHNLAPKQGRENTQTSEGTEPLELHTEEAFHEFRPDAFVLMGMRNEDKIPTKLVQVADLNIPDDTRKELRKKHFLISPDEAQDQSFYENLETVAIMDGHRFRYDPAYTQPIFNRSIEALANLRTEVNKNVQEVTLGPGDILFVNNDITVHGRGGYTAKYDGTDRWLKRVWLTRDLTKSRHLRKTDQSRVLY